jgi:hypothetical protein
MTPGHPTPLRMPLLAPKRVLQAPTISRLEHSNLPSGEASNGLFPGASYLLAVIQLRTGFFIISHCPVLGSHLQLTKTRQFFSSMLGKSARK